MNNHKKRFHTSVVESKVNDIDNDVDYDNFIKNDNDIDNDVDNVNVIKNDNDIDNSNVNRTLMVGPCFSGKTYLMMNKVFLSECDSPDRQIRFLTRSPKQYPDYETSDEISSIDEY